MNDEDPKIVLDARAVSEVHKFGAAVQMSPEVIEAARAAAAPLAPVFADIGARLERALNATPEERAEYEREASRRQAVAMAERARERNAASVAEVTVTALLAKLGWGPQYAKHVVQPYCECGDDIDGWSRCPHATDLGLETWQ